MSTLVYWAFFSGGIAAFSLTLGSLVGLTLKIPSYIIGILAAFGVGALLSALAIELVAPTVEHLVVAETPQEISESKHSFFVLIGGCIVGGLLFVLLVGAGQPGQRRNNARRRQRRCCLCAELQDIAFVGRTPFNLLAFRTSSSS